MEEGSVEWLKEYWGHKIHVKCIGLGYGSSVYTVRFPVALRKLVLNKDIVNYLSKGTHSNGEVLDEVNILTSDEIELTIELFQ